MGYRVAIGLLLSLLLCGQVGPLPGAGPFMPMEPTAAACGTPVATNVGTNTTNGGTATVTLTGVTVASSLIVVAVAESAATTAGSISDGVNTYSTAITKVSGVNDSILMVFYAPNASLSSGTITYTKHSSSDIANMSVLKATNILTSSPLDAAVTASNATASTTPSVTSGTPGQSGELFIAAASDFPGAGNALYTQDTGHGWAAPFNTVFDNPGAALTVAGGNQVNAGTGTKIFSPTLATAPNSDNAIAIFGFKHC